MRPHVDLTENFEITALYTAFATLHGSDYYTSGETHDFWEIVVVTEGEIGVTADKNVFYLKKGQGILHAPNEFHNLWSAKNAKAGILIFTFCAKHLPTPPSPILEIQNLMEPVAVLEEIERAFEKKKLYATGIRPGCEAKAAIAIKRLELFLLRVLTADNEKGDSSTSQSAKNYATVVKFLEENLHKSLTVGEIAAGCNLGEVNLKKTFSRYAGMGVMSYFNRMKIRAAVSLLQQGATVREAADALGFANQNYFSTVFTRIVGKPPKQFKG